MFRGEKGLGVYFSTQILFVVALLSLHFRLGGDSLLFNK